MFQLRFMPHSARITVLQILPLWYNNKRVTGLNDWWTKSTVHRN
jgi:hypothetical protein